MKLEVSTVRRILSHILSRQIISSNTSTPPNGILTPDRITCARVNALRLAIPRSSACATVPVSSPYQTRYLNTSATMKLDYCYSLSVCYRGLPTGAQPAPSLRYLTQIQAGRCHSVSFTANRTSPRVLMPSSDPRSKLITTQAPQCSRSALICGATTVKVKSETRETALIGSESELTPTTSIKCLIRCLVSRTIWCVRQPIRGQ